jgi:hypothetical protein
VTEVTPAGATQVPDTVNVSVTAAATQGIVSNNSNRGDTSRYFTQAKVAVGFRFPASKTGTD